MIIVNWNGRHLLAECLQSVCTQTLQGMDIVLVDNGSTDDSPEYARAEFPAVRVIELEKNFGFSAACNRAVEASSSPFLALLNNDAVAEPEWAERLLRACTNPLVGIAASRVFLHHDRTKLDSAGDGMTIVGAGFKRGHLKSPDHYPREEPVFAASGCAMLIRRAMLEDIGLLDEDFFFSHEDADLCFRAQLRGWKCVYVPDAVVYHKLNSSIGTRSRSYVYYGQRNVELLYFKNMPGLLLWKYLPAHLINVFLALLYFASKGRLSAFLRGKVDFLKSLRKTLHKRKEIQTRRTVRSKDIDAWMERDWLRVRLAGK